MTRCASRPQTFCQDLAVTNGDELALPIRLSMRNHFSTNHLWTALRLTALVGEIESAPGSTPRFEIAHRGFTVAAISASAGFLEASVSELFQDAYDRHGLRDGGYLAPLDPAFIEALATEWRADLQGRQRIELQDPIEKWQRLLECCALPRLSLGTAPAQDAGLVVRLWNYLLHYKPESIAADESHIWHDRLIGKFESSQLVQGSGNPRWPDHGLSHGCARWAIESVRALTDQVSKMVGIRPNYLRIEASGWMGRPP